MKALSAKSLKDLKAFVKNYYGDAGGPITISFVVLTSMITELELSRKEHKHGKGHHKSGNKECGQVYSPQWEAYEAFLHGRMDKPKIKKSKAAEQQGDSWLIAMQEHYSKRNAEDLSDMY
jgi:hypothetical protein